MNFWHPWRARKDQDLDAEIRAHMDLATQDRITRGETPAEAEINARREFGNPSLVKETTRGMWGGRIIEESAQDLRYALRLLCQSPMFAVVAIGSLALGIGANTALFSVVHTLLLKDLPYKDGSRLAYVTEYWPHEPVMPGPPSPDFANWRAHSNLTDGIAAYGGQGSTLTLTGLGAPERIPATSVTFELLNLIGVQPALGRNFTPEEDRLGAAPAVILGHKLWQRHFGSSPDVIGTVVELNGIGRRIVGVLPADFKFPDNNFFDELLLPMALPVDQTWHDDLNFRLLRVMVRLKPGVSVAALKEQFAQLLRATSSEEPPQMVTMRKDMEVRVFPLRDWLTGDVRRIVLVLEGAVALVLLIACLNLASLQVARAVARRHEMSLRLAVGAGKARLIRQMLTESLLVSGLAGGAGLLLAYGSLGALRQFFPKNLHLADTVRLDASVLMYTLAVTLLAGIVTGLVPAFAASRTQLHDTLKAGGSRATEGRGQQWMHRALVAMQIAGAMILLVGSGLLIRTFLRLAFADPGFQPQGVLTMRIAPSPQTYPEREKRAAFYARILEEARSIPGVEVALGGGLPLMGAGGFAGTAFEGRPQPPAGGRPSLPLAGVSPEYFHALGIPLLRGRLFTSADREHAPAVAIVNQAFAEEFYPGEDALGKRIETGSRDGHWREIVGIVGNVRQQWHRPVDPFMIYVPLHESFEPETFLILKSAGQSNVPPSRLGGAAAKAVQAADPKQPVYDVATMEERLSESLSTQRANMTLMGIFAALALILATIGIFGVIAYFVNRRTHEIGIRMALGASSGDVLKMVLGRGMALTAAGIVTGLAGALALVRTLGSLVEGTRTNDPAAFAASAVLFASVAAAACFIPARRASRVNPVVALRNE